jgi:hypothetical protein
MMPARMEVKINRNSKKKYYSGLRQESFICLIGMHTDVEPCCTVTVFFFLHYLVSECMIIVPISALTTHGWYLN